jgi:hypothetical protein
MTYLEFATFQRAQGVEPISEEKFDIVTATCTKAATECGIQVAEVWSNLLAVMARG